MENKKENDKSISTYTALAGFGIFVIMIYTIVEFIISTITGVQHNVLTVCVFILFALEIVLCSWASTQLEEKKDE